MIYQKKMKKFNYLDRIQIKPEKKQSNKDYNSHKERMKYKIIFSILVRLIEGILINLVDGKR